MSRERRVEESGAETDLRALDLRAGGRLVEVACSSAASRPLFPVFPVEFECEPALEEVELAVRFVGFIVVEY